MILREVSDSCGISFRKRESQIRFHQERETRG